MLAEAFLAKQPGARIVYDPRLTWNTIDTVKRLGGVPVMSKSGHAFIKQKMREVDGAYGGEMSAHHYFRDFSYCDSGMIPWLLVLERVCESGKSLDELVAARIKAFPASGEINRKLPDAKKVLAEAEAKYGKGAEVVDHTDGLSVDFKDWRFNVRALEHGTAGAAQCRIPRQRGADAREDRRAAGLPRFAWAPIKANH